MCFYKFTPPSSYFRFFFSFKKKKKKKKDVLKRNKKWDIRQPYTSMASIFCEV